MSNTLSLSPENFDTIVAPGTGLVLVDFWAGWCGPCMMLGPVIEELADELDGSMTVAKVNVESYPELARRYGVMTIPTVILFKDGFEAERSVGLHTKDEFLEMIRRA